jgi:hypothetical protein
MYQDYIASLRTGTLREFLEFCSFGNCQSHFINNPRAIQTSFGIAKMPTFIGRVMLKDTRSAQTE